MRTLAANIRDEEQRMRSFAMILDNPGEQPHHTRYRDPKELRELGYTDLIIYPTTGLSGLLGPDTLTSPDVRRWVADQYDAVQATITGAQIAGLKCWVVYDAPALATELVGSAMTLAPEQPLVLNPGSDELLDMCGQCLQALLSRIEGIDGVVLRLGDSDAHKVGYLLGHDIYQPRGGAADEISRADRLVKFITYFHDIVANKLGLSLMVRGWNIRPGGMHDDADLCKSVVQQLPVDDKLILSFKFTQTDFWRFQKWNESSLVCGDRPIVYELQCQREFEGKGAIPNYQVPIWRNGMHETQGAQGLADVADRVNLFGLWAWVRGGGWRGPYVREGAEMWIDANVAAVPKLAADPKANPEQLAREFITDRLNVTDEQAVQVIADILNTSAQSALELFYVGPYAQLKRDVWFPGGQVIQDDQVDAEALWSLLRQLPDRVLDEVLAEKQAAEKRIAEQRQGLQRVSDQIESPLRERLIDSLDYTLTFAQTLRQLTKALIAYRRFQQNKSDASLAAAAEQAVRAAQTFWVHHTQRIAGRGGVSAFDSDNLWDFSQQLIEKVNSQPA